MIRTSHLGMTAIAIVVGLAAAAAAPAATIATKTKINASGWCQGAFPSGAGAVLRARPLGLGNEGVSNAFVNCSFPYDDDAPAEQATSVGLQAINTTGAAASTTCTLVVGGYASGSISDAVYLSKTEEIAAGDFWNPLWTAAEVEVGATVIEKPNFSCGLRPGIVLGYIYQRNQREIGT